jgi:hypothetical protein
VRTARREGGREKEREWEEVERGGEVTVKVFSGIIKKAIHKPRQHQITLNPRVHTTITETTLSLLLTLCTIWCAFFLLMLVLIE